MNNEIIIIFQEVEKKPNLQKIKNDLCEFEKIIGRRS